MQWGLQAGSLLANGTRSMLTPYKHAYTYFQYDEDIKYENLVQFQTIALSVKDDLSLDDIVNYLTTYIQKSLHRLSLFWSCLHSMLPVRDLSLLSVEQTPA